MIPIEYRLEAKIEKTPDCWFWIGLLTYNGYGHPYKEQSGFYKNKRARRCHECHAVAETLRRKERVAI